MCPSICERSTRLFIFSRPGKIILRRGVQHMQERYSYQVQCDLFSERLVMSPASSIRLPRTSTGIGQTRIFRPDPTSGSQRPHTIRARGGTIGQVGFPVMAATKFRPANLVAENSKQS